MCAARHWALAWGFLLVGSAPVLAQGIQHHRIQAALDVPAHRIAATDTLRLSEPPEGEWHFLLNSDLQVQSVSAGGGELVFQRMEGWDPRRYWSRPPYAELDAFTIVQEVRVEAPRGGWADQPEIAVTYSGVIADSLHSPERAYGRGFETTTGRIVDQGAYLFFGSFWIPWHGEAPFTFDLTVDGPAEWSTMSQGRRAEAVGSGSDRAAFRWISEHPTEEVYLIAGPYNIERRNHRGISLETWTYKNTPPEISRPYLDAAAESIDRFSELLGPYPFSKFALVENYWQTGYGMPSFTFLGDRVIRLPFIVHTSYPHEILHNWWGNSVYIEGGNWCEGLTTYGADYAAKERQGGTAARDYRRDTLVGYRDFAAEGGHDFPLARFRERDSAATQAVGYGKTLMTFHMLRRLLGNDRYQASLRRFYSDNQFRAASWDDVRAAFEAESGTDLQPFFAQWIRRPGAVRLSMEGVRAEPDEAGQWVVRGELVQESPTFRAPVELVLEGEGGHRVRKTVEIVEERTPFRWMVDFPVVRVAADQGFDLFRVLHVEEMAPVLSGVLGADETRIVLGSDEPSDTRAALRKLADEWAVDSTFTVLEEADADGGFAGATWFFGEGTMASAFREGLSAVERDGGSLVATGRAVRKDEGPSAILWPESADVVPALGRKVPHYSKYSYLVFKADKNVSKGVWDPGDSPLVVRFGRATDGAGAAGASGASGASGANGASGASDASDSAASPRKENP